MKTENNNFNEYLENFNDWLNIINENFLNNNNK